MPECRAVDGAALAMTITMKVARVRTTCGAVRKVPGKGREQWMGRRYERRRGTETVKGMVLLNCIRQTRPQRGN